MTNDEVVSKIREIARPMGWAIGVHGSMKRDIDLIATPWVEDAKGTWEVFEAIHDALGGVRGSTLGDTRLPHGRQALMVIQKDAVSYKGRNGMDDWNPPAIDISFVDSRNYNAKDVEIEALKVEADACRAYFGVPRPAVHVNEINSLTSKLKIAEEALEKIVDSELHPFLESERLGLGKFFPDSETFRTATKALEAIEEIGKLTKEEI